MLKLEPTNLHNLGLGGAANFLYMNESTFNKRSKVSDLANVAAFLHNLQSVAKECEDDDEEFEDE